MEKEVWGVRKGTEEGNMQTNEWGNVLWHKGRSPSTYLNSHNKSEQEARDILIKHLFLKNVCLDTYIFLIFLYFLFYFFPKTILFDRHPLLGILVTVYHKVTRLLWKRDHWHDIQSPYTEIRNLGATIEYVFSPENSHAGSCKEVRTQGR